MNPFDFLNSICDTKKDLIKEDPMCEKEYAAFLVNRGLSYHYDTVMFANEMNRNHHLDKKMQYYFYLNVISKKKRFSKWHKAEKIEDVDLICSVYGYSKKKALEAIKTMSKDDIERVKEIYKVGGR